MPRVAVGDEWALYVCSRLMQRQLDRARCYRDPVLADEAAQAQLPLGARKGRAVVCATAASRRLLLRVQSDSQVLSARFRGARAPTRPKRRCCRAAEE